VDLRKRRVGAEEVSARVSNAVRGDGPYGFVLFYAVSYEMRTLPYLTGWAVLYGFGNFANVAALTLSGPPRGAPTSNCHSKSCSSQLDTEADSEPPPEGLHSKRRSP